MLADRVQQRVDAVGAVDVRPARRAEEDVRARRDADVGVAGRLGVVVGLGLDDHARRRAVAHDAAEHVAGDLHDGTARRTAGPDGLNAIPRLTGLALIQFRARVRQLLAHAVQRRPALGDLALQPRALGEHGVELVVEHLRVPGEVLDAQIGQRAPRLDGLAHQAGHDPVRLAERHAAAHEQVGDVGGRDHLVRGRAGERLAPEADRPEHPARGLQAQVERVDRVEQVLLVLLHVLVVGQREAVHHPVEGAQVRDHARRLRAQELRGVGVLLLGHDRGARGPGVRDLAEAELLARPQHDLGAQPRQVRRAGGRGGQEVQHEVAVGDRVDRVRRHGREAEVVGQHPAVGREVHARQRAGAERQVRGRAEHELEAPRVAAEHPEIGQQVVAEVDGLGALEMRVAGHRPVQVGVGELDEHALEVLQALERRQRVCAREHRHVGGDLVVARARGVQLAADRPGDRRQPPLDRHVDVDVARLERELPVLELGLDPLQARQQRVAIGLGDDPGRREHLRVRARLLDVVGAEAPVVADRGVELREDPVGRLGEARHARQPTPAGTGHRVAGVSQDIDRRSERPQKRCLAGRRALGYVRSDVRHPAPRSLR